MTLGLCVGAVFFVVVLVQDTLSLKDVLLTIEPKVVHRFNHSVLRCSYDLEDDVLYSVKWYRGRYEFYRFTPSEYPSIKTFLFRGIDIDAYNSNSTQVALRDIDFNISGNFSCEVTTDVPFFTGSDTKTMVVVQLPEHPPTISVEGEPLDYGDTLRANCSSPPSKPKATLTLKLNNLTVAKSGASPSQNQPIWSDLPLLMVLQENHFSNGRLVLRCISEIGTIYKEVAVLKLGSVRDPVPERVTSNISKGKLPSWALLLTLYIFSMLSMLS